MCGIAGTPQFTPQLRSLLPWMMMGIESRGKDAWGASDGREAEPIKHLGRVTDSWAGYASAIAQWDGGIFHTRQASQGSPRSLENAHPFTVVRPAPQGGRVVGIHNGHISNHSELNTRYGRKCNVDSEHIWHHLVEGRSWKELEGWANLAWWASQTDETDPILYLAHCNNDALKVFRTADGGMGFCSTMSDVELGVRMLGLASPTWYPVDENLTYSFRVDDTGVMQLWRGEKVEMSDTTYVNYGYVCGSSRRYNDGYVSSFTYPNRGSASASGYITEGICATCSQRVEGSEILCKHCLVTLTTQFFLDEVRPTASAHAL